MVELDATRYSTVEGSQELDRRLPFISKNFQYQALSETPNLPKETGGSHIERYRGLLVAASKLEAICHEVIEAPGKVILHAMNVATTVSGVTLPYEALLILTLVEEDGQLKILHCKDFANTRERNAFHTGTIEAAGQRVDA